ncbi:hypothetical protein J0S82_006544, partial [Galemys pyrenaicus]
MYDVVSGMEEYKHFIPWNKKQIPLDSLLDFSISFEFCSRLHSRLAT